ncbi:MAG: DUF362 domain-containing protein [Blastocatellia bacterium]
MTKLIKEVCEDARVAAMMLPGATYTEEQVAEALDRAAQELNWSEGGRGSFGRMIPRGARVLVKPNFVLHENQGPWGMAPLVTHQSLIRAVVERVLGAEPDWVLVGDAPIQGCDFDQLLRATGLDAWAATLQQSEPKFMGIRDFRRTSCVFVGGVRVAAENLQPADRFVLFDLGADSLLEPITDGRDSFRVTCYDPRLMAGTHAPGRHQYLVAREVMEADVIVNLPKLKTHKKAGLTCALKNLVGINGNKEYLPHHRVGGSLTGGDCYPGGSLVKRGIEYASDQENMAASFAAGRLWHGVAAQFQRLSHLMGDQLGTEGSWSGNDTVWRMSLDLNRILLYGRTDGTMAEEPQRQVLHVVDAGVAGQGDGPLSPRPLPLGLIMAGRNAAAVDWVGAHLLGYDAERVTIVREAFGNFQWPIASFTPSDIVLVGDWKAGSADRVLREQENYTDVIHPHGWRDAARRAMATAVERNGDE